MFFNILSRCSVFVLVFVGFVPLKLRALSAALSPKPVKVAAAPAPASPHNLACNSEAPK